MNKRRNVILLLHQKNESAFATGDPDVDPDYSLSDDSYSDTSDNQRSSFDEANVSALNEPQYIVFSFIIPVVFM
jgi:hypothetical protein